MNPLSALSLASQSLSRFSSVLLRFAIGVGLLLADPLLPFSTAAPKSRLRPASGRSVAADSEPTPKTPSVDGSDLALTKEGQKKAEALAAFAEGIVAEEDGDQERAFKAYRRSLSADPDNTELAVKVALELARRGEVAEGIALLKDAAKGAPQEMLPPLCLSQIYAKFLKKPAIALKYAQQALELDPDNIGPYMALVELYTATGQPRKAGAVMERALKSESRDATFWAQLGEICARLDLNQNGEAPPEKLKRIDSLFEKALGCDPQNPEVQAKAADYYFQSKQFERAIPLYRKVVEAGEEGAEEERIVFLDKLARCLIAANHPEEAVSVLEKLAEEAPSRMETQALLGELHLMAGRVPQALASYEAILRLDPRQAPAYLRIADLQMRLKQGDKALATLKEARKQFPGTALITYSLAVTLAQNRQFRQALEVFEATLREAPASKPGLPNAAFYFAYGMAAEQAGETDRAAALLKKSIALAPNESAQACNFLGYMWVERSVHLPEAAEFIQRALALEPQNGAYLDSLGWYYFKIADYPKAIATLLQALAHLQPEDAVVYEHLGDAYAASGDAAKGLDAWKKALALDPGNKVLAGKIGAAQQPSAPVAKP